MMARSTDAAHCHPDDVPCWGFGALHELVLAIGRVAADGHFRSSKWPEDHVANDRSQEQQK